MAAPHAQSIVDIRFWLHSADTPKRNSTRGATITWLGLGGFELPFATERILWLSPDPRLFFSDFLVSFTRNEVNAYRLGRERNHAIVDEISSQRART